jgi:Flp pilus assembly pilin Flp
MKIKRFLQEDQGAVVVEYVILVAAAGLVLAIGVGVMFSGMSDLFNAWAGYFAGGS